MVNDFKRLLKVKDVLAVLNEADPEADIRWSRVNPDGTYGSMPLHDVSICPDGKVLIKTFYTEHGNIKQPSINLDDF